MQKDFHFYTIYTLCRTAGLDTKTSQVIAYASQYTDDAKYGSVLTFQHGGRYRQIMTAHRFLDIGALSKDTFYTIFVPFHFLPGMVPKPESFYEKLVCKANSQIAQEMMAEVLSATYKPYFLHRLGIGLHTYADTWAHQHFSGVLREENNIKDIDDHEEETTLKDYFDEAWMQVKSDLIPAIGHGKAGNLPDIPYKTWRYVNDKQQVIEVNNKERFLEASKMIFEILCTLSNQPPLCSWQQLEGRIERAFAYEGSLKERIEAWEAWIEKGVFYIHDEQVRYDEKAWFREAVEVIDSQNGIFAKKEHFSVSNWKYFQDAAAIQLFYILHELLPKYGIFCG
ncbi:hypothetical protein QBE52_05185 [Clostridiaceae bacterium 35-E11]